MCTDHLQQRPGRRIGRVRDAGAPAVPPSVKSHRALGRKGSVSVAGLREPVTPSEQRASRGDEGDVGSVVGIELGFERFITTGKPCTGCDRQMAALFQTSGARGVQVLRRIL